MIVDDGDILEFMEPRLTCETASAGELREMDCGEYWEYRSYRWWMR